MKIKTHLNKFTEWLFNFFAVCILIPLLAALVITGIMLMYRLLFGNLKPFEKLISLIFTKIERI